MPSKSHDKIQNKAIRNVTRLKDMNTGLYIRNILCCKISMKVCTGQQVKCDWRKRNKLMLLQTNNVRVIWEGNANDWRRSG